LPESAGSREAHRRLIRIDDEAEDEDEDWEDDEITPEDMPHP
jgi:hypothetical protein